MRDRPQPLANWNKLAAFLAYLGVAVVTTWPLAAQVTTHLPGGTTDTLVHYWNGWWAGQALDAGLSPFHTPYLYHPTGLSLVYHNFAWMSIVAWLPLKPLLGGFTAYNLVILVNLALGGTATFLLAYELTGKRKAAFLSGLIYQCWPFRLSQLDHPNLMSTQWIPVFLLFLIRAVHSNSSQKRVDESSVLHREQWRDGVLAGVFLALVGYTRWQQLIPAAIMAGIYLTCALVVQWVLRRRSPSTSSDLRLPVLLLVGGTAFIMLTPPASLLVNQQRTAPADLLAEDEALYQTDLVAYITPSRSHTVLGSLTQPVYDRYYANRHADRRFPAYIGVTVLALVVMGISREQNRYASFPWVVMALVLLSLALGPTLLVNGKYYPAVPMPYRLAARLLVVRLMRVPDRFNMFLALPTAILAAYGVTSVLPLLQRRGHWVTRATLCLLGGAILFEYLAIPVRLQRPPASSFYAQLSAEPGDFAVLNLPRDTQESKRYMFAQVTHQHPIMQGKTARFPKGTFDYLNSHPWLRSLRQSSNMPPSHTDTSRQLAALAQDGIRYIILHKIPRINVRLAHWRRYFVIPPRFKDELIVVYPTTPLAGIDFVLTDELLPGIGPIRVITSTECVNPGRVLEVDVGWGTTAPPGQDLSIKLALVVDGDTVQHEQVFPLSSGWPTGEWPANTVAWGYYAVRAPSSLPSGTYAVMLELVDAVTGEIQGHPARVGQVAVSEQACTFPLPSEAISVNALFGDDLRLLGYQLYHDRDRMTLTLHWRSEQRMETDYTVFVHVFDPEIGSRVAQDDAMPLRWTYPTTFWGPGEIVPDDIPLSLSGVPAGDYSIAVGVYEAGTMERLPVVDEFGQVQPDAQLVLPGQPIEVVE